MPNSERNPWERLGGADGVGRWTQLVLDALKESDPLARTPGSQFDADRTWSEAVSGVDSVMPSVVAMSQLIAARQHLQGLHALLPLQGVDIPTSALARAACESAARAAHVLDRNVTAPVRFARAMNETLNFRPSAASRVAESRKGGELLVSLTSLAIRLDIPAKRDKQGRVIWFGAEPRPTMRVVTLDFLRSRIRLPEDALGPILNQWNGSAHGGLDAGLGVGMLLGPQSTGGDARLLAGSMALSVCTTAHDDYFSYHGQPSVSSRVRLPSVAPAH